MADKGRIGQNGSNGNGQADMFCRTVIAAVAAMLALKLCRIIRHWLQG